MRSSVGNSVELPGELRACPSDEQAAQYLAEEIDYVSSVGDPSEMNTTLVMEDHMPAPEKSAPSPPKDPHLEKQLCDMNSAFDSLNNTIKDTQALRNVLMKHQNHLLPKPRR